MKTENLISVKEFCVHHQVEFEFIDSLNEYGLIKITTIEENQYIIKDQLSDLEKMIRLRYDLDINIEGIEAIAHLLQRVENLHEELNAIRNKVRLYEKE